MRFRRDVSAGVIVFHRSDDGCRFLLILSRLTRRPLWEFPKGGVDRGESRRAAALRELREETGLDEGDIRMVDEFEHTEHYRFSTLVGEQRTLVRKEVTYFLAEASRTDVQLSEAEASEFAWLDLEAAKKRLRYSARRKMLDAASRASGCQVSQS